MHFGNKAHLYVFSVNLRPSNLSVRAVQRVTGREAPLPRACTCQYSLSNGGQSDLSLCVIGGCDRRSARAPALVLAQCRCPDREVSHFARHGCSLPAATARALLRNRTVPTPSPRRVFLFRRGALSLVSVVCVKILLRALRPLSGGRVRRRLSHAGYGWVMDSVSLRVNKGQKTASCFSGFRAVFAGRA